MNTYSGTISFESNYKSDLYFTTVKADSLESAVEKTIEKWKCRFLKPRKILEINLKILKE